MSATQKLCTKYRLSTSFRSWNVKHQYVDLVYVILWPLQFKTALPITRGTEIFPQNLSFPRPQVFQLQDQTDVRTDGRTDRGQCITRPPSGSRGVSSVLISYGWLILSNSTGSWYNTNKATNITTLSLSREKLPINIRVVYEAALQLISTTQAHSALATTSHGGTKPAYI